MTRPVDDQLAKLPKWARDYIVSLERDVSQKARLIDEITNGGESEFSYTDLAHGGPVHGRSIRLPKFASLSAFDEPNAHGFRGNPCLRISVRAQQPRVLEIMSICTRLLITPHSSNSISVYADPEG